MLNRNTNKMSNTTIEPLDESEQIKILDDLKIEVSNQSQLQRKLFYYLFIIISIIFICCSIYSMLLPWDVDHQRHFQVCNIHM